MAILTLAEIEELAARALVASRTSPANAKSVALSIAAAEADGIPSHGLLRVPVYCAHAKSGKVDGMAVPTVEAPAPGAIRVDARNGFAHPAIDAGLSRLAQLAREQGVAVLAVRNSYNSGVMGYHVERLAWQGLVGLAFANAPAVIAPWQGRKPLFGTNPIAFAAPRSGGDPVVIDQASSVVARGEVMLRSQRGESIPEGWGMDSAGRPTTDPQAVLDGGSMAPSGGYKGVTLALMVELFAAALTGSRFSSEAGSLTANDGKPAGIGQLFIAIDPARLAGPGFAERIEVLCEAMLEDPGVRLPGSRRVAARTAAEARGVTVDSELAAAIAAIA